jgi:hypothetical protein
VPIFKWLNEADGTILFVFEAQYANSINGASATLKIPASEVIWQAWNGGPMTGGLDGWEDGGRGIYEGSGQGTGTGKGAAAVIAQRYVGPSAFEMAPIPI